MFVSVDQPRPRLDSFISRSMRRTLPEMLTFIDHEKARGAIPSSGASGISRHGMLAHSMVSARRATSSYSFQNAFFYLQFPDDPGESKSAPRALKKTRRKAKFNPQKQVRVNFRRTLPVFPNIPVTLRSYFRGPSTSAFRATFARLATISFGISKKVSA